MAESPRLQQAARHARETARVVIALAWVAKEILTGGRWRRG